MGPLLPPFKRARSFTGLVLSHLGISDLPSPIKMEQIRTALWLVNCPLIGQLPQSRTYLTATATAVELTVQKNVWQSAVAHRRVKSWTLLCKTGPGLLQPVPILDLLHGTGPIINTCFSRKLGLLIIELVPNFPQIKVWREKQAGTELGQAQLPNGIWLYCD